jgi:hypothetical protein
MNKGSLGLGFGQGQNEEKECFDYPSFNCTNSLPTESSHERYEKADPYE